MVRTDSNSPVGMLWRRAKTCCSAQIGQRQQFAIIPDTRNGVRERQKAGQQSGASGTGGWREWLESVAPVPVHIERIRQITDAAFFLHVQRNVRHGNRRQITPIRWHPGDDIEKLAG